MIGARSLCVRVCVGGGAHVCGMCVRVCVVVDVCVAVCVRCMCTCVCVCCQAMWV